MLIREKIKLNYVNDLNLKFNLSSNNDFIGYQQEIDNYTFKKSELLINPINDYEIKRFKLASPTTIYFLFYRTSTSTTSTMHLTDAGFTEDELKIKSSAVGNSFFIVDIYDNYDIFNQNKLSSIYMTKITEDYYNGVRINTVESNYTISNKLSQFYYLNIPNYFIKSFIESGITSIKLYAKFSFFQAKDGILKQFYNSKYSDYLKAENLYHIIDLNLNDNTWKFQYYTVGLNEIKQTSNNNDYVNKINNNLTTINNEIPQYPSGNTFEIGTYRVRYI